MPGIELSATPPVSIGNTVIDVQSRIVVIQGDRVEFTSKEFDLLCFFAKYPNWALTRGQILDSVWDDSPAATYHAVENAAYPRPIHPSTIAAAAMGAAAMAGASPTAAAAARPTPAAGAADAGRAPLTATAAQAARAL